jgi:hypothetical protein
MGVEITDHIAVRERAEALGCVLPDGIAILPSNFSTAAARSEFLLPSEAATVRSLYRSHNLPLGELLPSGERPAYIQNNSFDWIAPTFFISASMMTENPALVTVALNVLSSYVADFLRGRPSAERTVKLDVIVEKKGDRLCKKLHYEGEPSGLDNLPSIIQKLFDE